MKKRPHIPLSVRVKVAFRQVRESGATTKISPSGDKSASWNLKLLLEYLFGDEDVQLDHNPALGLRDYNEKTGKWSPDANDPDYLIYRKQDEDHRVKTYIRGEHGARSDIAEMKYRRRVKRKAEERKSGKKKPSRLASRPFSKGRSFKWPSRPMTRKR